MKTLATLFLLFVGISCFSQEESKQMIALKTGDTLTVSKLEIGDGELIFRMDGIKKGVRTTDVKSYFVTDKWYDMLTGKLVGSIVENDVALTSVMALDNSANANVVQSNFNRSMHLRKAGSSLITGTALAVILSVVAVLVDNPQTQTILGIGAGVSFVGFQISAGSHLMKASDY